MKQPDGKSQDLRFRPNRTFICSVVYIDIVEYSKKPVNEQIQIKERFNALLTEAIRDISVNDRIILDTGDGAAISFLGDPEDALFVAMSFRDYIQEHQDESTPGLPVRIGINLGPVKLLRDINNQPNLIGDGINVAQRIMSFAEPGQLLVSRSYFEIVSCLSQEYAKLFEYQGARADKHIREHDIYAVGRIEQGAMPIQVPLKKPAAVFVDDDSAAQQVKPPATDNLAAANVPPPESLPGKKPLMIGGAIAAAIIVFAAVMFISKSKAPVDGQKPVTEEQAAPVKKAAEEAKSSAPEAQKEAPAKKASASKAEERAAKKAARAKAREAKAEPAKEGFRRAATSAEGISFNVAGVKASGNQITITVKLSNRSDVAKSVALYDDAFSWPKSKIVDTDGTTYYVNTVTFSKNDKTVTAQAAGRNGIDIAHDETVTAHLTFKNIGKRVKEFALHPFIYQGRGWKEHDLAMHIK